MLRDVFYLQGKYNKYYYLNFYKRVSQILSKNVNLSFHERMIGSVLHDIPIRVTVIKVFSSKRFCIK